MNHFEEPMVSGHTENNPPATAAIIISEERHYLLQQRDNQPGIWYPGFWGLFGGAIDPGETPQTALRRELFEELHFIPQTLKYFTQIGFDLRGFNAGIRLRYFYEVSIEEKTIPSLQLNEGKAMKLFTRGELLQLSALTPYDSIALRLHLTQEVIWDSAGGF